MQSIRNIFNWVVGSTPDVEENSDNNNFNNSLFEVRRKLIQAGQDFVQRSTGISPENQPYAVGTVEGMMNSFFNASELSKSEFEDDFGKSIMFRKQEKLYMKVRLLLVETGIWRYMPNKVNELARTYSADDTPLGLVHAGLQIGPYIVDWTRFGLAIPHKLKSNSPILLAEINEENESSVEMTKENLIKICSKIVEWNTKKTYSTTGNNCQKFTLDVLGVLGLPTKFSGSLGAFLDRLSAQGTMKKQFEDKETKTEITFTSHEQLDNFILEKSKDIGLEKWKQEHPDDWILLKGFDRAFWLKITFSDEEKWPKENKPSVHGIRAFSDSFFLGCPFDNPGLAAKRLPPVLLKGSPNYIDLESISKRANSLRKSTENLNPKEELQYLHDKKEKIEGALASIVVVDSLTEKDFEVIEKLKTSLTDIEKSIVFLGDYK